MPKRERSGELEQAGPSGCADEGEGPDLHHMGARCRALPDDDVELVVLERGVELLFQHRLHAMNFIEKQDLALAQVGEYGGQVALNLQRRTRGLLEAHVEFIGNDGGEGSLAQSRRAKKQDVIESFAARFGGFEGDGKLLFCFRLADELAQPAGAQFQLKTLLFFGARSADETFRSVVAGDGHAEGSLMVRGWRRNRNAS